MKSIFPFPFFAIAIFFASCSGSSENELIEEEEDLFKVELNFEDSFFEYLSATRPWIFPNLREIELGRDVDILPSQGGSRFAYLQARHATPGVGTNTTPGDATNPPSRLISVSFGKASPVWEASIDKLFEETPGA